MSPQLSPTGRRRSVTPGRRSRRIPTAIGVAFGVLVGVVGAPLAHAQDAAPEAETPATGATATLGTPVLSARRAPEVLRSNISDARIREAVQPLIDDAAENSCIAVSLNGRLLAGKDVSEPKTPASLAKLLTASAVLSGLDPQARLQTTAASTGGVENGVVDGDLYIIGGGDPLLTTPAYQATFKDADQPVNPFERLADNIEAAGVREIRGDLVGDDSRYSTERWIPTWPTNYRTEGDVGPLSALLVNDGYEGYTADPIGAPGSIDPGDPPLLAVQTLRTLLEDRGIEVTGSTRAEKAPDGLTPLAQLDSLTVAEMVSELIDDSDNVTGELLTRELGLQTKGDGSTPAGVATINESLAAEGMPLEGANLVDGSGLDPDYTVTCALMVAALDDDGRSSTIGQSLPVAAETGTLKPRMIDTAAAGNVQAKTGSLAAASALAGFVTTASGTDLTFAYILNGSGTYKVIKPLDELAVTLAELVDGPDLADLSPEPAGA